MINNLYNKFYKQKIKRKLQLVLLYLGMFVNPSPVDATHSNRPSNNEVVRVQINALNTIEQVIIENTSKLKSRRFQDNEQLISYQAVNQQTLSHTFVIPYWLSAVETNLANNSALRLYYRKVFQLIIIDLWKTEPSIKFLFKQDYLSHSETQYLINLIDIHLNSTPNGRLFIKQILEKNK